MNQTNGVSIFLRTKESRILSVQNWLNPLKIDIKIIILGCTIRSRPFTKYDRGITRKYKYMYRDF